MSKKFLQPDTMQCIYQNCSNLTEEGGTNIVWTCDVSLAFRLGLARILLVYDSK